MTNTFNKKEHWENIYATKEHNQVSWYQKIPDTSLQLIDTLNLDKNAAIIDIGGGDSLLAEHLLKNGFTDITVVDISKNAIDRAKERIGENAKNIHWIVSDIVEFTPERKYDVWHDRATFHFLTADFDIQQYKETVGSSIKNGGHLLIGTFSTDGPTKCSGIDIKQYSDTTLIETFKDNFTCVSVEKINHQTPFDTLQNFVFATFVRK